MLSASKSGEPVSLSTFSLIGLPTTVVSAIKLADGRVRTSESLFLTVLYCLLFMPVLGILAGFITFVVLAFVVSAFWAIVAGFVCAVLYAMHGIVRYLREKSAF